MGVVLLACSAARSTLAASSGDDSSSPPARRAEGRPPAKRPAIDSSIAGPPDADTPAGTDSPRSATFDREFLESLPLVGRRFTDILTLAPGVTDVDRDGYLNVAGARDTGVQFRLDGFDITDPVDGGAALGLDLDALRAVGVTATDGDGRYGRFDGGLAPIATRSGNDAFAGSAEMFWRGNALDGDGTNDLGDTFQGATAPAQKFHDLTASMTAGGPIRRGRLWYFANHAWIDNALREESPGSSFDRPVHGSDEFVKLSWIPSPGRLLDVSYIASPLEFGGVFAGPGIDPESGGTLAQHARALQLAWRQELSAGVLLELRGESLDSGLAVRPMSDLFHTVRIARRPVRFDPARTMAVYPTRECSFGGNPSLLISNCDPALGPISISYFDAFTGETTGPIESRTDDARTRRSFRADVTLVPDGGRGRHEVLVGLEADLEAYSDDLVENPLLVNQSTPCPACRDPFGQPLPNAVTGSQLFLVPTPSTPSVSANGLAAGAWLSDRWKVGEGLVLQGALRMDRQDVDSAGFTSFDPHVEQIRSFGILEALCAEGLRIAQAGGISNAFNVCPGIVPGRGTPANLIFQLDGSTPASIRRYDTNKDKRFDEGSDGRVYLRPLTQPSQRLSETVVTRNADLSPRVGLSWDPWASSASQGGKTVFSATWGRYFDRLYLRPLTEESAPSLVQYVFTPDRLTAQFQPGQLSAPGSAATIQQVDRDLRTPRTDDLTIGAARELSTTWRVRVSYTRRKADGLLQDADRNHVTCRQYRGVYGTDPRQVCPAGLDPNGNVIIGDDLFGATFGGAPNGLTDLYVVNPYFNQVLRIGNFNDAAYRAATLEVVKHLSAGWQLQGSYTLSHATGQAGSTIAPSLDDPAQRSLERAVLDWDQRHRVVLAATGTLPHGVDAGIDLRWESGIPFSIASQVFDEDNAGNLNQRAVFPTGARNDQRNGNSWNLDARLAKRFQVGKVQLGAEIAARNLLDQHGTELTGLVSPSGALAPGFAASVRRPGRSWQLGAGFYF
ncbi:MAG: hypothetical protein HY049_15095 [Acidobacteria bacterium]|nr:hypothetical protein [Acidobacteriota bacterium]